MAPLEVDLPDVVAEVRAVFARYEAALLANDLDVLDELFWDSPATVRYGFADVQHGFAEVTAFRRSLPRQSAPRRLVHTVITTFGHDVATVWTQFVFDERGQEAPDGHGMAARVGRQSQTWARVDGGWRVVAAHVSWPS
jgi:hypothetical protein